MKAVRIGVAFWFALFAVGSTMAQLASKGAFLDGKAQYASLFSTGASLSKGQFLSDIGCEGGLAGGFSCQNVDLVAFMPTTMLGGSATTDLNDIWGWTDPLTRDDYVLVGLQTGTSIVRVTNPASPTLVAFVPTASYNSSWRDIKVWNNHAYIVSEADFHGMQVVDLTVLRSFVSTPLTIRPVTRYTGVGSAHNVASSESLPRMYVVGGAETTQTCGGGIHIVDITQPQQPSYQSCYAGTGYVHDVQCVTYRGPDTRFTGREICISSSENDIGVLDATDASNVQLLAVLRYPGSAYIHQAWFTHDQQYLLQDDELDEMVRKTPTMTNIWDMSLLDEPELVAQYQSGGAAIDHNQYVVGDVAYQTNYTDGLRVLDIRNPLEPVLAGYFDTSPGFNRVTFDGTWSNYPYFRTGVVALSDINSGLFLVRPHHGEDLTLTATVGATPNEVQVRAARLAQTPWETEMWIEVWKEGKHITDHLSGTALSAEAGETLQFDFELLYGNAFGTGTYELRVKLGTYPFHYRNVVSLPILVGPTTRRSSDPAGETRVLSGIAVTATSVLNTDLSTIKSRVVDPEGDGPLRLSAYPNPSQGTSFLRLVVEEPTVATISVFDVLGRKRATIFEGEIEAGSWSYAWDAEGPAGVYFFAVDTSAGRRVTRFVRN